MAGAERPRNGRRAGTLPGRVTISH